MSNEHEQEQEHDGGLFIGTTYVYRGEYPRRGIEAPARVESAPGGSRLHGHNNNRGVAKLGRALRSASR